MMQRVLIEFVVDVPNTDVAGDVMTRLTREHATKMNEMIASVTGFAPMRAPGKPGLLVASEAVTWNEADQDWVGPDDDDDDDDDEDGDDDEEDDDE